MSRTTQNGRLAAQLNDVLHCLADLDQRGLRIAGFEIGKLKHKPRIRLEAPWVEPGGLTGGMIFTNPAITRYATDLHHCQVEWEVPA
ncbi:MAG: hypothetical protein RPT95_10450 [Candidatus Sedimenticola sp. (ex Thyasira tokunagai)]